MYNIPQNPIPIIKAPVVEAIPAPEARISLVGCLVLLLVHVYEPWLPGVVVLTGSWFFIEKGAIRDTRKGSIISAFRAGAV